ncbi:hypothetical protein ACSFA3_20965 [Variovorax sp. RHLX14]|uniref:hypothetical protein n=1 Tax=Variovorax sp. RHLX14 TaxID=1259731 RepID=UPI003F45A39D
MPFELLGQLAHATLPLEFKETEEINALLALNTAGLVVAEIPGVILTKDGPRYDGAARVTAVTSEGIAVLKKRANHPGPRRG